MATTRLREMPSRKPEYSSAPTELVMSRYSIVAPSMVLKIEGAIRGDEGDGHSASGGAEGRVHRRTR
jgi:hypothetical protein